MAFQRLTHLCALQVGLELLLNELRKRPASLGLFQKDSFAYLTTITLAGWRQLLWPVPH
jgi:hypothetical protein